MVRNTTVGSLPLGLSRRLFSRCSASLFACLTLFCGLAIFCGLTLQAQSTAGGGIQGTITDAKGAAVVKAQITATNTETGAAITRTSTSTGSYSISPLAVGTYNVEVVATGFQRLLQENINVDNASMYGLNLALSVGSKNETITVTDAPPSLDTTDATLGGTIENELYSELPLSMNGGPRDATAFQYLMPGVQENPDNNTSAGTTAGSSGIYGGTGATGLNENYVEGVPVTNISSQGNGAAVSNSVSVDAVDQFSVQTNGASSSFGGAGVTNYTIKSGGNQLHGAIFDYIRNTMFDTWGYFSKVANTGTGVATKPGEHQNNYGGSLGGPILKDKLFFFGSYEGYHYTKISNTPSTITIPTLLNRTGDFTDALGSAYPWIGNTIQSGASIPRQSFQGLKNGVKTYNVIEPQYISSISQYLESALPTPQNSATTNNYLATLPLENSDYDMTVRLDYTMNSRNKFSLVGTGGLRGYGGAPDYTGSSAYNQLPVPYAKGEYTNQKTASGIFSYTYIASQSLINSVKYGFTRNWGEAFSLTQGTPYTASKAGIGNLPTGNASDSMPIVNFATGNGPTAPSSWGSVANSGPSGTNSYTIIDNLQWIKGRHNITFGAQVQWLETNGASYSGFSNVITLNYTGYSTENCNYVAPATATCQTGVNGDAYASFLIGAVNSGSESNQSVTTLGGRYRPMAPYIQDNWQITSKLTLNLGFRYDYLQPYHEVQDRMTFINVAQPNPVVGNILGVLEFGGLPPSGDTSADYNLPYYCHCTTPVHPYNKNFEPRLGFAYAYTPTTVISGAFSVQLTHSGGVGGASNSTTNATSGSGNSGRTTADTSYNAPSSTTGVPAFYLNPVAANYSADTGYAQKNASGVVNTSNLPTWNTSLGTAYALGATGNYSYGNYFKVGTAANCAADGTGCGQAIATDGADHYGCTEGGNTVQNSCDTQKVNYADPYYGGRGPQFVNWNFSIQKMINKKANLNISYAGSETHFLAGGAGRGPATNHYSPDYDHLLTGTLASAATGWVGTPNQLATLPNYALPYPGFTGDNATVGSSLTAYPQFGNFNDLWGSSGNSNSNSLQVMVIQRPWHNLSGFVNYTRMKEIDNTGTHRTQYGVGPQDGNFAKAIPANHVDRGLGKNNQTNAINVTWVYKFPFGRGQAFFSTNRIAGLIAGGWELSGIYKYRDGYPIQISQGIGCQSSTNGGQGTCLPDYNPSFNKRQARINGRWGRGPGSNASNYQNISYINPLAFACPDDPSPSTSTCGATGAGQGPTNTWKLGNVGRSAPDGLTGPGWWDVDMGLRRTFTVRETATLHLTFQLEADVQNVTNSTFFNLNSSSGSAWYPSYNSNTGVKNPNSFGVIGGQNNSVAPRDWQFQGRFRF